VSRARALARGAHPHDSETDAQAHAVLRAAAAQALAPQLLRRAAPLNFATIAAVSGLRRMDV
jgi:hypothetical protein